MEKGSSVQELEAGALQALIDTGNPVLVDVWASWCGPCNAMFPVVDAVAREHGDELTVVKLEIDNPSTPQNDAWTQQFGIRSVPTFILFRGGTDIAGFAGTATAAQFRDWLKSELQKPADEAAPI